MTISLFFLFWKNLLFFISKNLSLLARFRKHIAPDTSRRPIKSRQSSAKNNKNIIYFYIFYLLFVAGYTSHFGAYYLRGTILLLILCLIALLFFLAPDIKVSFSKKFRPLMNLHYGNVAILERGVIIISVLLSLNLSFHLWQQNRFILWIIVCSLILQLGLTIFLRSPKLFYICSLSIVSFLGILTIVSIPAPQIDVYVTLKEGTQALLAGKNPYSIMYSKINDPFYDNIIPNYYTYLPGMIFLTLPGVLFLNDPRYSILFFTLASAVLLLIVYKNYYLPVIFLFNPMFPFILGASFTEPMMFFLIALFFILSSKKRFKFSAGVFSFFLGAKQYAVLFLPFYWLGMRKNLAVFVIFFSIILAIIFPFFIWDKQGFIDDALLFQFKGPVRYDGLSLVALLHNTLGVSFPIWLLPVIWILAFLLLIFFRKITTYSDLIFRLFLFLFIFFFFNKWASGNYYYLLSSLLILSIAFLKQDAKLTSEETL